MDVRVFSDDDDVSLGADDDDALSGNVNCAND